jgi:malonyl-CoA/methylmalonyl-CoA synthetase
MLVILLGLVSVNLEALTSVNLPLLVRAEAQGEKTALVTAAGQYTYRDLLQCSAQIATQLLAGAADLEEQRVAFLVPSGFDYVAVQWGIWRAGGVAVPLCVSHPRPELDYVIRNAAASILVAHPSFAALLEPVAAAHDLRLILTSDFQTELGPLPAVDLNRRALMLYTSGTTGKPKGVVTTHHNLQAQVTSLVTAWDWSEQDRVLHVLPLHHIHGIVNVLTCALWVGAECHMISKFDSERVWDRIGEADLTLFMAVPTIYTKLIAAWKQATPERQLALSQGCAAMRLMVSGSAALPVQVLEQWQKISGHLLLERYGMTEIGMALSNPLHGPRRAGFVGMPLPGVEVRLVDEGGQIAPAGVPGEIQVKGPGVFLEYWQKPAATAEAFQSGWFRTGDLAVVEQDSYRILGRLSVDIIKTGGYKVSALEIEEVLRSHSQIQDCAVVGVADPDWGERVCAALVLQPDQSLTLDQFRSWAKAQLAVYKVPTRILPVAELPRNAMGKVTKPAVAALFQT